MKFLKRNKNVLITFLLLFLTVSLISLAVFNKNENTTYEIISESYAVADKELSEEIKTDLKEEVPIQKESKQNSVNKEEADSSKKDTVMEKETNTPNTTITQNSEEKTESVKTMETDSELITTAENTQLKTDDVFEEVTAVNEETKISKESSPIIEAKQEKSYDNNESKQTHEEFENNEISNDFEKKEIVLKDEEKEPSVNNSEKIEKLTCTLTIKCGTILNNLSLLNPGKADIVPPSGIILAKREVEFFENESVFNVLLRETKKNKIHFEFSKTPGLGSVYIEGIANIYEFDCGDLSGWIYSVNKSFPNYSCSEYKLNSGDEIEFIYTCNSGSDIR